jgi:hypothetical protein
LRFQRFAAVPVRATEPATQRLRGIAFRRPDDASVWRECTAGDMVELLVAALADRPDRS